MSSDPTGTEVFPDVDPDPDAILDAFGAESPDDLVAGSGRHDPSSDDAIDAAAESLADLFAHIDAVSTDPVRTDDGDETERDDDLAKLDVDWAFVGDPETVVSPDDDVDTAATAAAELPRDRDARAPSDSTRPADGSDGEPGVEPASPSATRTDRSGTLSIRTNDELELVGPEPTTRRIPDDSFGATEFVFGGAEPR